MNWAFSLGSIFFTFLSSVFVIGEVFQGINKWWHFFGILVQSLKMADDLIFEKKKSNNPLTMSWPREIITFFFLIFFPLLLPCYFFFFFLFFSNPFSVSFIFFFSFPFFSRTLSPFFLLFFSCFFFSNTKSPSSDTTKSER